MMSAAERRVCGGRRAHSTRCVSCGGLARGDAPSARARLGAGERSDQISGDDDDRDRDRDRERDRDLDRDRLATCRRS